jgi:murein DD-endopeptidase MepM/ murein hydrolase activator NlpD
MHIARVALSFFVVGFVAGTFEQAAGPGDAGRRQRAASFVAVAEADEPAAAAPQEARRAPEPEAIAAAFTAAPTTVQIGPRRPMSLPGGPGWSPIPAVAFLSRPADEIADALTDPGPRLLQEPRLLRDRSDEVAREFVLPIDKGRVTSMFNQGRWHPAIDLAAPLGTPVSATTPKQRVTFAGRRGGYGNLVIARDPSGRLHYYGHLHRIGARVGTVLEQGEVLGLLGSTGHSTGPHVHYEVRTPAGRQLDPAGLLFPGQRVARGYAWDTPRIASTRLAARSGQPRPR